MSTRAVVYARISKDRTGEAVGVDRQVAACGHLAAAREWDLVAEPLVDNDLSAYSGVKRPAYEKLMGMIDRREVDAVIAWDMDRMLRRVADLVELLKLAVGDEKQKRGAVRIATVHGDLDLSSPIGRMFATILIAVAEYEAAHKGERQVAANEQAAKSGKRWTGCPRPFGYQADRVTLDPQEAAAVEAGYRMILAGGTISGVVREWTLLGVKPPLSPGKPWSRTSARQILLNPHNAGIVTYKGDELTTDHEAQWKSIVSVPTWKRVHAILTDDSRQRARGTRTLLGGLAHCPCGNVIIASKNQHGQPVYRCQPATRDGRPGPHVAVRVALVDDWVTATICTLLAREDAADLIVQPEPGIDVLGLRQEAHAIRGNLDEMAADRAVGLVTRSQMIAATQRGETRLAEINAQLAEAARESVFADLVGVEDVAVAWDRLDLSRQRAVVAALFGVVLHPVGRGVRDPDLREVVEFV